MKIVVSFKVVSDDQDIQVSGDGSLDFSRLTKSFLPTISMPWRQLLSWRCC